ncbi:LysR family transcriptional regulator [uncultured Photobacterium sp.]|uniref:LysR family transcriptional regulator n=1 Tax=uncultured Photobacterium sp. TaxID=173973 RepID=UPI002608E6F8|nr:LysR family transcriptional regulator [uncultured Photobacterium sp.]
MNSLNLNLLKTFYNVVLYNSFSIAADKLYISKSVVSKHIKLLEEGLNCTLIQRTTRTINLTDEGRYLYNHCIKIFSSINECYEYIDDRKGEVRGKLRLKMPPVLEHDPFVTNIISKLMVSYPNLNLDIVFDNNIGDLVGEGFDVAFYIGQPEDSSYKCRKVKNLSTYVVASPDYIKTHGEPIHPQDLVHHRCMNYSHCLTNKKWTFTDNNQEISDEVSPYIESYIESHSELLLSEFAIKGLGITVSLDFIAEPHINNGALLSVLSKYTWKTALYIIYPDNLVVPLKTRKLIELLFNK